MLHRLHPLTKGIWLVSGTILVFVARSPWVVAGAVGLLLLGFPLAGVALGRVRGTRLFVSTALLLGLLQVLFVRAGRVLFQIGPLAITVGGVEQAIYVAGRFLSVILLSYLFVLTTEPNDLAYALMRAGLPYRYGFALITALAMLGLLFTGAYVLKAIKKTLHDTLNPAWKELKDISWREAWALILLVVLILITGIWPRWILDVINAAALLMG